LTPHRSVDGDGVIRTGPGTGFARLESAAIALGLGTTGALGAVPAGTPETFDGLGSRAPEGGGGEPGGLGG
jgi:hypothetical protein